MVNKRAVLKNLRIISGSDITIGDGRRLKYYETGTALVVSTRPNDYTALIVLENLLVVPQLEINLLSCTELEKEGFCTVFKVEQLTISRNGVVRGIAHLQDGLYILIQEDEAHAFNAHESKRKSDLWNQRYGNLKKTLR